ncbi:MarR family transcriptional regulator [Corynebacterium sp. MSK008]|uniref:MarR family winged helix-turn-helix transcriptional regulator n=1 Tax=Corynebacterium sp. MSK008 TaxID=3050188 RepID=UPI00254E5B47|nr:MarR family transcriptional regulator [Corynebacterium sp. MSK008]MDK8878812.1 MarR family transcriptional regulator [Corynebacterium sp. MSK008]
MNAQPRWLEDDEQQLWRLMLAGFNKISRTIDDRLQEGSDISSSEFSVLVTLSEAEDRTLRLRELCDELGWDRSRASHQVTRMKKRGLLTKSKCPGDARGVLVTLTDQGMAHLEEAVPDHVETVRRLVFDNLDPDRADRIREFFTDVIASKHLPANQL